MIIFNDISHILYNINDIYEWYLWPNLAHVISKASKNLIMIPIRGQNFIRDQNWLCGGSKQEFETV